MLVVARGSVVVARGSVVVALIPVGPRFEPSCPWNTRGTKRSSGSTVGWTAASTRRMGTPPEGEFEAHRDGDSGQHLQADALGKTVLDHRPHRLAHSGDLAQMGLGLERRQSGIAQIDAEMKDHVLDRDWLVAKVVRHRGIGPDPAQRARIDRSSLDAGLATITLGDEYDPRAMDGGAFPRRADRGPSRADRGPSRAGRWSGHAWARTHLATIWPCPSRAEGGTVAAESRLTAPRGGPIA